MLDQRLTLLNVPSGQRILGPAMIDILGHWFFYILTVYMETPSHLVSIEY
jgi:hypothetical protein